MAELEDCWRLIFQENSIVVKQCFLNSFKEGKNNYCNQLKQRQTYLESKIADTKKQMADGKARARNTKESFKGLEAYLALLKKNNYEHHEKLLNLNKECNKLKESLKSRDQQNNAALDDIVQGFENTQKVQKMKELENQLRNDESQKLFIEHEKAVCLESIKLYKTLIEGNARSSIVNFAQHCLKKYKNYSTLESVTKNINRENEKHKLLLAKKFELRKTIDELKKNRKNKTGERSKNYAIQKTTDIPLFNLSSFSEGNISLDRDAKSCSNISEKPDDMMKNIREHLSRMNSSDMSATSIGMRSSKIKILSNIQLSDNETYNMLKKSYYCGNSKSPFKLGKVNDDQTLEPVVPTARNNDQNDNAISKKVFVPPLIDSSATVESSAPKTKSIQEPIDKNNEQVTANTNKKIKEIIMEPSQTKPQNTSDTTVDKVKETMLNYYTEFENIGMNKNFECDDYLMSENEKSIGKNRMFSNAELFEEASPSKEVNNLLAIDDSKILNSQATIADSLDTISVSSMDIHDNIMQSYSKFFDTGKFSASTPKGEAINRHTVTKSDIPSFDSAYETNSTKSGEITANSSASGSATADNASTSGFFLNRSEKPKKRNIFSFF